MSFILNEKPGAYFSKANREKLQAYIDNISPDKEVSNVAALMMYLYDRATEKSIELGPDDMIVSVTDQGKKNNELNYLRAMSEAYKEGQDAFSNILSSPALLKIQAAIQSISGYAPSKIEAIELAITAQASEIADTTDTSNG